MIKRIQIALVGDFDKNMYTHVALNESIEHCRPHLNFELETPWIPTENVDDNFLAQHTFKGFWIAPGSPYENDKGVYKLIRWARENNFPLYGTCGGFQYMIVEYAQNVLGFSNAGHEESDPDVERLVISKLECSLKGKEEEVLIPDKQSWLYNVLKTGSLIARYYCSYGINPEYIPLLEQYPMVFTAFSKDGQPRAFEVKAHRFYAGTLFQPPLDSSSDKPNPLLISFFINCSHG